VALVGVFERGTYSLIIRKYGKKQVECVPHVNDPGGTIRKKICRTKFFSVLVAPDGKILCEGPDENDIQKHLKHTYAAFTDLPRPLEKLPVYLKHGLYARAYALVKPCERSTDEKLKKIYTEAMKLISAYRKALLEEIESLEARKDIAEAYRLASTALNEFRGVRNGFTARLRRVVSRLQGTREVSNLLRLQRVFLSACSYLDAGQKKHAKVYFESLAKQAGGTYYGKRAAAILKAYF